MHLFPWEYNFLFWWNTINSLLPVIVNAERLILSRVLCHPQYSGRAQSPCLLLSAKLYKEAKGIVELHMGWANTEWANTEWTSCSAMTWLGWMTPHNQIKSGCWESISWIQASPLNTGPFLTAKTTSAPRLLEKNAVVEVLRKSSKHSEHNHDSHHIDKFLRLKPFWVSSINFHVKRCKKLNKRSFKHKVSHILINQHLAGPSFIPV